MNKKSISFICLLLMAFTTAWAQAPNNTGTYYKNANGKSGQALKTAMSKIILVNSNQVPSYSGLISEYTKTDVRSDGYLRDWYSNSTHYVPGSSPGTYSKEGDAYNREHLVPQSWFSSKSPMQSDIMHVVPADGYLNNRRNNNILAEVGTATYTSNNGYCKLGKCKTEGYTGTVFEPNDEVKGDIARIYFYMATCYEDQIPSWTSNATASYVFDGNSYPGFLDWYLNMLMRWSQEDPIDDIEIARNNAVYGVQGNRNPFVDYPGLEDYIWGKKKSEVFSYDNYDGSSNFVSAPIFSPEGGTYTLPQNVTITTATPNATIYYAFGNASYSVYTPGTIIPISVTTTLKAYAEKDGEQSEMTISTYIIDENAVVSKNTYAKVTSDNQIYIGGQYILVNESHSQAAGTFSNRMFTVTDISLSGDVATLDDNSTASIFTLGGSASGYSLKVGTQYLTSTAAKALSLTTSESKIWSISSSDDGYVVNGNSTIGTIQYNYNSGNPRFLNYTSSLSPAVLYVKTDIDLRHDPNLSYTTTVFEVEEGKNFDAPTLNNPYHLTGITYSTTNKEVATVNESTGEVTIGKPGVTIITATFDGNSDYKPGVVSYLLRVTSASSTTGVYAKITTTDDLEVGKNYLIVYEESPVAYAGYDNKWGLAGSVTIKDNQIDLNNTANIANVLVLEKASNGNWLIKDGDKYLALTSESNSIAVEESASSSGTEWTITFTDGDAIINNVAHPSYYLQFNSASNANKFRCYKGKQKNPALYKEMVSESTQPLLGDVNGDGLVNIADVVAVVNHILGNTPEVFYEDAADVNGNGEINIADVTALVNIILSNS